MSVAPAPLAQVKICGITRLEDARKAIALGAWAVGFIFYPKSPRYLSPATAAEIIRALPAQTLKVGVFVNATVDEMKAAAQTSGITAYQLHGEESLATALQLELPWIKAFRPTRREDLGALRDFSGQKGCLGILVDAAVAGEFGGTGRLSDWELAREAKIYGPIFLSGGLTAANAREAQVQVAPFSLDLSSGVEAKPGIKDHQKLEELFDALS